MGVLFLRTLGRAERIHAAMVARGFDGRIRTLQRWRWGLRDTVFLAGVALLAGGLFVASRF